MPRQDEHKQAAKGKVLQASPIEEDDTGAEAGAYKGNQDSDKAILGWLEVIVFHFQRTVTNTQAQEDQAQAKFINFDRTAKADIDDKETKIEFDEQDLVSTEAFTTEKKSKTRKQTKILWLRLWKILRSSNPCVFDSEMSHEERAEKRKEEIEALKGALCQLDAEGVEPSYQ